MKVIKSILSFIFELFAPLLILTFSIFLPIYFFWLITTVPQIINQNLNQKELQSIGSYVELDKVFYYSSDNDTYKQINEIINKGKVAMPEESAVQLVKDLSDFKSDEFLIMTPEILSYTKDPELKNYLSDAPAKKIVGPKSVYFKYFKNDLNLKMIDILSLCNSIFNNIIDDTLVLNYKKAFEGMVIDDEFVYLNIDIEVNERKIEFFKKNDKMKYEQIMDFFEALGINTK